MSTLVNHRYQIEKTLGAGGFGETFLVIDTQMPSQRRCVLKQLRPMTDNPQIYQIVQARFQREAAILETLGRGNDQIPELFAYFTENGLFYLVQELIEGQTLTDKIATEGARDENFARQILLNALPVLDFVHSKGIIHRDIKPDNIILRITDAKPVLIDFGAVKEMVGTMLNSQGNVTSSIVIGTLGFMSNEQAAGRPIFSSDLYSLGLTAIFALTGKVPQALDTDLRTGEILWQRDIPDLTPEFAAVLDRSIQPYPRDRYATASEMLTALQATGKSSPTGKSTGLKPTIILAQQPVSVQTSQTQAQNPRQVPDQEQPTAVVSPKATSIPTYPPDRNPVLIGSAIVGGLVSTAVFAGFYLMQPRNPSPEKQSIETSSPTPTTPLEPPTPTATIEPPKIKPLPPITNQPERIVFSPGATGETIQGSIQSNLPRRYIISAEEGQQFILNVIAGDVKVKILAPAKETLTEAVSYWENALPETGDYSIEVLGNANTSYQISIEITGYPWLEDRRVTDAELKGKSPFQLDVMRNEIYARHGRIFDDRELQSYFGNQSWYEPKYKADNFPDDLISPIEKQNAAYILQYQNRNGLK